MSDMYKILESLLEERGISGGKMSSDLGMSRSFMTELRKGRAKSIKAETAQKIADYFGVSVAYLLGEETKKEPATQTGSGLQGTGYDLLNEKNKAIVDSLIETLLASQSDS